ncbi:MAG: urease accessory protein UreD [Minicystis sp.]
MEKRSEIAARTCAPGEGSLTIAHVAGQSAAVGWRARAPLHLLVPRPRGVAAWAYVTTFGGGLVAGDNIALSVDVAEDARALLTSQATTKVYRSEGAVARQDLSATVARGGLLAVLPEPVCCFAGAIYAQRQRFDLAPEASLALVDCLSAGRTARRERWCFTSYRSSIEIKVKGRLIVRESSLLEDGPAGPVAMRFGRFDAIAVAVLVGPALSDAASRLLDCIGRTPVQTARRGQIARASILASASPIHGGAILRVSGESVEEIGSSSAASST